MSNYKKIAMQLVNLVTTISNRFPKDKKLSLAKTAIETLKNHNTRTLATFYISQIYLRKVNNIMFKDIIAKRDLNFFLENNILEEKELKIISKNVNILKDENEMDSFIENLMSHWSELTGEERESVWVYFDVLNLLSERLIIENMK